MEWYQIVLLIVVSFGASWLTFYSGFGLGTMLLPVFALWFPLDTAIIMTALVHLMNNLFKVVLVKKHIDPFILLRFGIPSIAGAIIGSLLLNFLNQWSINFPTIIAGRPTMLSPIKLIIGLLIILFGILEFINFGKKAWSLHSMTGGGLLSGFFGGLSGHQGALRSAFLLRYGLTKEVYIGTGVAIACLVDVSRIVVYIPQIISSQISSNLILIVTAILFAFGGAWLGNRYLNKLDLRWVKTIAATGVILIGILIAIGII